MSNEQEALTATFVQRLNVLDAGDRARFKRNAGKRLAEADHGALTLLFGLLPHGVPTWQEEMYFLVATLFPLAEGGGTGDLGTSLRRARAPQRQKGLERRLAALLDADEAQLPFRLRQTVHLLQSARAPVNWPVLLQDLLRWNHPERHVQRRWARSYYAE